MDFGPVPVWRACQEMVPTVGQPHLVFPMLSPKQLPRPFCLGTWGNFSWQALAALGTQLVCNKDLRTLVCCWFRFWSKSFPRVQPRTLSPAGLSAPGAKLSASGDLCESRIRIVGLDPFVCCASAIRGARFGSRVCHPSTYNGELPSPPLRLLPRRKPVCFEFVCGALSERGIVRLVPDL